MEMLFCYQPLLFESDGRCAGVDCGEQDETCSLHGTSLPPDSRIKNYRSLDQPLAFAGSVSSKKSLSVYSVNAELRACRMAHAAALSQ